MSTPEKKEFFFIMRFLIYSHFLKMLMTFSKSHIKWCTCTTQGLSNACICILLIHVVIIHCNNFLPLLLTASSVNLVVLLTLSCVTVPQPSYYLSITPFSRSRVQPCDCLPSTHPLVAALQLCSTVKRTIKSLSFLSGIKLLVA